MSLAQKSLLKKTFLFQVSSWQECDLLKLLLNCKRLYLLFLLTVFLIIGCTTLPPLQTEVFHGPPGTVALIVFVDTPSMYIKTMSSRSIDETLLVPFYHWIFKGFRYQVGQSRVIFDDKTVVSHAIARGIKPVVSYRQRYGMLGFLDDLIEGIKSGEIIHLTFDEPQIPALYTVARELGASHLVKARLIATDLKREKRTQCTWYPERLFRQADCRIQMWAQTVTVEFTVHDVLKENIMLTHQLTVIDQFGVGNGLIAGFITDSRINEKLASVVVTAISRSAQAQSSAKPLASSTISIENRPVIWKEGGGVPGRYFDAWVKNTSIIDGNLFRFDISLLNHTEQKLSVTFKKETDNKLDTYIKDTFGIIYGALSLSMEGYSLDIRAGERKDFFFVFPLTAIPVKQVDLFTTWNIQTPQGTDALTFEFKDVPLPPY